MDNLPTPEQQNSPEGGHEHTPTPEEIASLFEKLLEGKKFEEVRKLEDEQGLYLWDIKISDEEGDIEYSYMRKGQYREGQASATAIHMTIFDEEGVPAGGHSIAKYTDGEWKLTP